MTTHYQELKQSGLEQMVQYLEQIDKPSHCFVRLINVRMAGATHSRPIPDLEQIQLYANWCVEQALKEVQNQMKSNADLNDPMSDGVVSGYVQSILDEFDTAFAELTEVEMEEVSGFYVSQTDFEQISNITKEDGPTYCGILFIATNHPSKYRTFRK